MDDGTVFYSICAGLIFAAILLPFIDTDKEGRERIFVDGLVTVGLIVIIMAGAAGLYFWG